MAPGGDELRGRAARRELGLAVSLVVEGDEERLVKSRQALRRALERGIEIAGGHSRPAHLRPPRLGELPGLEVDVQRLAVIDDLALVGRRQISGVDRVEEIDDVELAPHLAFQRADRTAFGRRAPQHAAGRPAQQARASAGLRAARRAGEDGAGEGEGLLLPPQAASSAGERAGGGQPCPAAAGLLPALWERWRQAAQMPASRSNMSRTSGVRSLSTFRAKKSVLAAAFSTSLISSNAGWRWPLVHEM